MEPRGRQPWPSLVWPILLIGVGVILLLSNMGVLPAISWGLIWRLWPLGIILLGIELLIGRRSRAGQLLAALLALALIGGIVALLMASPTIPILRQIERQAELQTETIQTALEGIQSADLEIDWESGVNRLGALSNGNDQLLQGEIRHYGELIFNVQTRGTRSLITIDTRRSDLFDPPNFSDDPSWQIDLNPAVSYRLRLDQGSGAAQYDLKEIELEGFLLDGGSGSIELWLPDGSYPVQIDQGSGDLTIHPPSNSGLSVQIEQGSGNFNPGGFLVETADDVWETQSYDQASQQIEVEIDQGSGNVLISGP